MNNAPRPITSLTNDRVKFIRSLEMRKVRKETGLFVAEGTSISNACPTPPPPFVMAAQAATHDNHRLGRAEK